MDLRILKSNEIMFAAQSVVEWGYPRDLDEDDFDATWAVGERDGELVGYLWMQRIDEAPRNWVLHIAVHPEQRGKAFSRAAFAAIRRLASRVGAERLWLGGHMPTMAPLMKRLARFGWVAHDDSLFSLTV